MKNATVAFIGKVLVLLFAYASRVVLVRVLNQDYVGTNGLLNNILGTFSLLSLGIDAALCYLLYKPVAEKDFARQQVLMRVYRKVHALAGGAVFLLAVIMFFMMNLISPESFEIPNFVFIYWLFAGNVIMGFFLSHKPMVFIATQQNYVNELFESGQLIAQYVIQILVLILTRSFLLYTLIYFLSIVVKNIAVSAYADKRYPYLKVKNDEPLKKEDKKEIIKNLWAILVQKFGVKIINYTDTIILSSFFGLTAVAKFTTYHLVIDSVRQLLEKVVQSITGSVGNLNATTDKKSVETVYNASLFITAVMFGIISICLFEMLDLFVELSFGADYVYQTGITLVLCINLYLNGIRAITTVFRNSLGLFWNDRYRSIIESIANIIFSLAAIYIFGEIGIFLGTTASVAAVPLWVEPAVLYKSYFNKPLYHYFLRFFTYSAVIGISWAAVHIICSFISLALIPNMIVRLAIGAALPAAVITALFFRTEPFRFLVQSVKDVMKKRH